MGVSNSMTFRPIAVNPSSVFVVRWTQQLLLGIWIILEKITPGLVMGFFYVFSAFIYSWLDSNMPSNAKFAIRVVSDIFNIPVPVISGFLILWGLACIQDNISPFAYLILLIPGIVLSTFLAYLSITGIPLAWTAVVYTTTIILFGAVSGVQKYQITQANMQRLKLVAKEQLIDDKILETRALIDRRALSQRALHEMLQYHGQHEFSKESFDSLMILAEYLLPPIEKKVLNTNADTNAISASI